MPIYEYRCNACGQEHEVLQKVTEPPLTDCPACGKPGLQKLLSAAGFQLKGSGWYATDFKGNGKKKADEKKPEQKDSKTESKTDSKPKPETKSEAPA
jgi:putative FmdB family regulatory protein